MKNTLKIRDKDGNFVSIPAISGEDGKSAYQYAVDGGFNGTEEEFAQVLASLSSALQIQLLGEDAAEQIGSLKIYYSFAMLNKELGTTFDVTTPIETIIQAMPDNTGFIGDMNTVDKGETSYPKDAAYGILSIYKIRENRVMVEYVSNTSEGSIGYNRRWVGQYNAGVFGGFKEVFTEAYPPTAEQVGAMPEKVLVDSKDVLNLTKDGWYYSTSSINVPTETKNGYVRVMTNTNGDYRVVTWQPRDSVTEYTNVLFEGKWLGWAETLTNPFMSTLYLEGDVYKPLVIKNKNSYYALEKYRTIDGIPCRMDVGLGIYPSAVLQVAIGKKGDAEAPETFTHRLDLGYNGLTFSFKNANNEEVKNIMFGENNKPSGSYVGNGEASRQINTGGIGNALLVWHEESLAFAALVTPRGTIFFEGSTLQASGTDRFENGILYTNGTFIDLNNNGRTYKYQVL